MTNQYKNNPVLSTNFSMPYVHELMSPIKSIEIETQVLDVLTLFDIYSEVHALAIHEQSNIVGIITRSHYLYKMPRLLVTQIFKHSSLKSFLTTDTKSFAISLVADVDDRIDQIVLELLTFDLKIELLPVKNKQGIIIGIVKLSDLELKLFEAQMQLIQQMTQTSARLRNEVEIAAILQRNSLTIGNINLLGVRGLVTLVTSSEIGGDFCDYYTVNNRWLILLVGDVSGHGVASGTIVSVAKAIVSLLERDREIEPSNILSHLNTAIFKTAKQSLLMTMLVLCIDTQTKQVFYANAGHQFPYLYRSMNKQLLMLEESVGLPLGTQETIHYEQYFTTINNGDCLFIYTDALVEEENSQGECFGYDRLEDVLKEHIRKEPEYLRDIILERFSSHIERCEFSDDVTLCHLEFNSIYG
ncbi:MAG: SpoIIE family protein phosphatase [Methylococcaceae bacterium]